MSEQQKTAPAEPRGPIQYRLNATFPWFATLICLGLAATPAIVMKNVTGVWNLFVIVPPVLLVVPVILMMIVKWKDRPVK